MLQKLTKRLKKSRKGVTLVELIVVVAILAILAAMLIPSYLGYTNQARISRALSDLGSMRTVVEVQAATTNGMFPSNTNVGNLMTNQNINWTGNSNGITDPWGHGYAYATYVDSNGNSHFAIASAGPGGTDLQNVTANYLLNVPSGVPLTTDVVQPSMVNTAAAQNADLSGFASNTATFTLSTNSTPTVNPF